MYKVGTGWGIGLATALATTAVACLALLTARVFAAALIPCATVAAGPTSPATTARLPGPERLIHGPNWWLGHVIRPKLTPPIPAETLPGLMRDVDRLLLERPDGRYDTVRVPGSPGRWLLPGHNVFTATATVAQAMGDRDRQVAAHLRTVQVMAADERRSRALAGRADSLPPGGGAPAWFRRAVAELGLQAGDPAVPDRIAFRDWLLYARWPSPEPAEAMVSLRDIAFTIGNDPASNEMRNWYRAWRVDWTTGQFTLLAGDHELTFTRDSAEAILDGDAKPLRRPCEQVYFDLYVPVTDLVELLGGELRRPREGELTAYSELLPVGIWVMEVPE